jgi:ABC-type multidrug transport system fused ATPase/permease subunit
MTLIKHLLKKYFFKNKFSITFLIILSCTLSLLKINVIALITANIIKSIKTSDINNVFNYYKYFIIASILYIIIYIIYKFKQNNTLIQLRLWIRKEIIDNMMKTNNENLSNDNFSKLSSPINRVTTLIYFIYNNFISYTLPNLTILFVIFIYFIYNNFNLGIIFLFFNIIIILVSYFIIIKLIPHMHNCENKSVIIESNVQEILNNFDKIIYRGYYQKESDNLDKGTNNLLEVHYKYYKKLMYSNIIINIIVFFSIFSLLFYLIYMFCSKKINITIFITFFTILLLYRDNILNSMQEIPEYIEYMGRYNCLEDIFKLIKIYNDNDEKSSKNDIKIKNLNFDNIKIRDVSFKYSKINIINNLNIEFDINNIIGIVGQSGKGKSTIAKLIIKMYKYNGNIYIDNINLQNIDTNYLRSNIIYVNQNSKLFDKNINENLFYGCNDKSSIDKLNIIMKYPNIKKLFSKLNFNKKVGLSGGNISGGERQIINIINGLITPSKILILDEPTNALDIELKKDLINLIKHFKQYKKCIIIISHDYDIFSIFDKKINI